MKELSDEEFLDEVQYLKHKLAEAQFGRLLSLARIGAKQKWISVKEKLPEDGVYVNTWPNERTLFLSEGRWYKDEMFVLLRAEFPTHWLPLPSPPKMTEQTK